MPTPDSPMMRAAVARRYGGPEEIAVEDVAVPEPGRGQVLVQVERSSLNALDWHFLTGTPYLIRPTAGFRHPKQPIPGADVAGTVAALGPDVTGLDLGDAVFGETRGGGCARFAVAAAANIAHKPDGVSNDAAASAGVAALTAIQGLRTHGALAAGEHVLINGAAGGVGTFAVQIAKATGAEVTAVASTRNMAMVERLGADHVIDYTKTDWADGGERFDVMLDNVGNGTAADCIGVLRPNGRYVAVSGPKHNRWLGPLPHVGRLMLAFRRAPQSFHQFVASPNRTDLTEIGRLLADGLVVPEIQRVIGLDDVAEALAEIGTGHTRAKIVVDPSR